MFCDAVIKIYEPHSIDDDIGRIQHIQKQQYLSRRSPLNQQITDLLIVSNTKNHSLFASANKCFSVIQNNLWYIYFKKRLSCLGENWIDFEKEISHAIKTLEAVYSTLDQQSNTLALPGKLQSAVEELANNFGKTWYIICANKDSLLSFRDSLSQHLDSFIYALEIYLFDFVGKVYISVNQINSDIKSLRPDAILSFNYTNTYRHIYHPDNEIKYCFIHGKATHGSSVESSKLVLGIDEHLKDDRKNTDLEFLHFRKYFQRIYKSTDNNYLNWLDDIRRTPDETHMLYIFGHSLDVTDKDVLYQLICNDNVQTRIFYHRKHEHDKNALGQLIHNLVRILGPDELIRRTAGSHKTIEFIPQTLHK